MNIQKYAIMADTRYILDTSSVRGIKFRNLQSAVQTTHIAVSTVTILELLCHIDEVNNWNLFKTNILKCELLELLNDPFAEQAERVGARSIVNPTRFDDKLVLPQLYRALRESATLEDFYNHQVHYPSSEVAAVEGVASRTRDVLTEDENKYRNHVMRLCKLMLSEFGFERSKQFTPSEFVKFVNNAVFQLAADWENKLSLKEGVLLEPIFSTYYPYFGYGLMRGIEYLKRANGNIDILKIDPNDMEDSAICAHLSLTEKRILVTSDDGTYQAIRKSLEHLQLVSASLHQDIAIFTDVIYTKDFEQTVIRGQS